MYDTAVVRRIFFFKTFVVTGALAEEVTKIWKQSLLKNVPPTSSTSVGEFYTRARMLSNGLGHSLTAGIWTFVKALVVCQLYKVWNSHL